MVRSRFAATSWLGFGVLAFAGATGCVDCGAGISTTEPGDASTTLDSAQQPVDAGILDRAAPDSASAADSSAADQLIADRGASDEGAPRDVPLDDAAQTDAAQDDAAQPDSAQPPLDAGLLDLTAQDLAAPPDSQLADQLSADLTSGDDAGRPDAALADAAQPDSESLDAGACPSLSNSLTVSELSTGADDVVAYNTHVYTAPRPGGGTVIGWSSNRNVAYISEPKVHLTWTDAAGDVSQAETVIEVNRAELGGLAAAPDGYALLLYSVDAEDQDVFSFVRVDDAGQLGTTQEIAGGCDPTTQEFSHAPDGCIWPRNWWHMGGIGHLVWAGTRFAAYFAFVTTVADAPEWGEADTFRYYDTNGDLLEIGATMGCTHSLARSLAWNGTKIAPVCLQDIQSNPVLASMGGTIPHGGGTWAIRSDIEEVANVATTLGEVVAAADGFWVSWTSIEGGTNNDVRLAHFSNDGEVISKTWLTDTPGLTEQYPHLAPFEGGLVAAWQTEEDGQAYLARVDGSGQVQGAPEPIAAPVGAGLAATAPFDGHLPTPLRGLLSQFTPLPNGDVVWAVPTEESAYRTHTEITLVRLSACR